MENSRFKKKGLLYFFVLLILLSFNIVKADNKKIDVTEITVKDKSGTIDVSEPSFSGNEIESNITFKEVNDFVIFEITLWCI